MNRRRLRPAVVDGDSHQNVVRRGLAVFRKNVEVAVVVEDPGVEQLEFRLILPAPVIFLHQLRVGEFPLRILVKHFQIGMCRGGVEVIICLLHVFAVVAFTVRQAEKPLLQNWIVFIPQRQRQAKAAGFIADAGNAVLAPAIGAAAGMVVREILPGGAAGTVILAHGAPLPFGKIGSPQQPRRLVAVSRRQTFLFRIH